MSSFRCFTMSRLWVTDSVLFVIDDLDGHGFWLLLLLSLIVTVWLSVLIAAVTYLPRSAVHTPAKAVRYTLYALRLISIGVATATGDPHNGTMISPSFYARPSVATPLMLMMMVNVEWMDLFCITKSLSFSRTRWRSTNFTSRAYGKLEYRKQDDVTGCH